jgi:polyphosphate glucokinase
VVRNGVVHSAANIDKGWVGTDADGLLTKRLGRDVHVLNDADAAGVAELRYGAARGRNGLVILTTLGTGIGSAFLYEGVLVPNSELGHLEIDGHEAEKRAAASIRTLEDLSWPEYAARLTTFYRTVEKLFSPDLLVVGGGVSKDADQYLHLVDIETEIIPATLRNRAGIIGAAAITSD